MENQVTPQKLEEIIVEPSRLQCGLWGFEEGDISKSYSADVYGERKAIRQPFIHASRPYVAMSIHGKSQSLEARAYPLIHESYRESILEEFSKTGQQQPYYYVGKPVSYRKQNCILGLQVIFKQRAYTDDEHIDLLRRMYAYGGMFAAEAGSYANFLLSEKDKTAQSAFHSAILNELAYAKAHHFETQEHLRTWVEKCEISLTGTEQLSLL